VRWYDYLICLWIADGMSANFMMVSQATTLFDLLWYSAVVVLGYFSFVFYADRRKEMINQKK